MRLRTFALVWLLCFVTVALASAQNYSVKVERGVEVKMRDGVILRGDCFAPVPKASFRPFCNALHTGARTGATTSILPSVLRRAAMS